MRLCAWVLVGAAVCAAAPAHAGRVLRMATIAPEGTPFAEDFAGFAREVAQLSDGELTIKWYWAGALGDDVEMAEKLQAGKVDGAALTDVGLNALVPEMVIWGYPGLFEDYAEADYIEKSFRNRYDALFDDRGLVLLVWADIGFLHVFSDVPITSLGDLRKKSLWLWSGDYGSIFSAALFGIPHVESSLAELAEGLRAGKFDTFQFPPIAAIAWGLHPYAKYVSELRFRLMLGAFVFRKDVFDELPADQQRLLRSVGRKWERRIIKGWRAESQKAIGVMVDQGMRVAKVSEKARQSYYQQALAHQPEFAKKFEVEDLMGEFVDALRKFREARSSD